MADSSSSLPRGARPFSLQRRGRRRTGFRVLAVSLAVAVSVGLVIHVTSTSVPFLATSPTTDPTFGRLNQCLLQALREPRVGFAVSVDGRQAAAFGGRTLALCEASGEKARTFLLPDLTAAAFDFQGGLWLSSGLREERLGGLWQLLEGQDAPRRVWEVLPLALAGSPSGVVVLDRAGKLVSISARGQALAFAQLPGPPGFGAQLSVDPSGTQVAVVAGGGVFLFESEQLTRVRAESPCQVEHLWWTKQPGQALLSCGPDASWALLYQVQSGAQEVVPPGRRIRSSWVAGPGVYVQACEGLPCTAPPPFPPG